MKLAIIGSRNFDDYEYLKKCIQELMDINTLTAIVSGGAKGADSLAEHFAQEYDLELMIFKPDYQRYQRKATFIRNRQIIDTADVVVAFWDGNSTGTKYTLDYAKKHNKPTHICHFEKS